MEIRPFPEVEFTFVDEERRPMRDSLAMVWLRRGDAFGTEPPASVKAGKVALPAGRTPGGSDLLLQSMNQSIASQDQWSGQWSYLFNVVDGRGSGTAIDADSFAPAVREQGPAEPWRQ